MIEETACWWEDFYDGYLADVLLEGHNDGESTRTVEFLKSVLGISRGDLVFDQCCGTGRVAVPLAEAGFRVVGIDLIEPYVASARAKLDGSGFDATFQAADAFEFVVPELCAGALNWWTSFGYAMADRENVRMLERAFESITPGGRFALDFMNAPGVLRHFQKETITRGHSKAEGEILLIRESKVDVANGVLEKDWTYYIENGKRVKHHTSVRLYHPPDLRRLFETVGFANVKLFGDLDASPITLESPRCIIVGTKP